MVELHRGLFALALGATMLRPAFATPPANQVSLNICQKTVKAEGAKFVQAEILAIATCLQKLSLEAVQNNVAFDNAAAQTCITQFRKINDSRNAGKSLKEKLAAKIQPKCDKIFNPNLAHTDDDITGKGSPTVPVPLNTKQLDSWCMNFGGDGSIDGVHTPPETTVREWIDCIAGAHQCEVEQAIAEQYPRAAEWLTAVKPLMQAIPTPSADPTKIGDAVTGLTTVHDAIDQGDTGTPHITCPQPPPPPSCSTACCYVEENVGSFKPTSCFEYTGSTTEVATFKTNCNGKQASPAGFWTLTATNAACTAGPTYGTACVVGGAANNAVAIPKDSACP
jgi:hypothetical protein